MNYFQKLRQVETRCYSVSNCLLYLFLLKRNMSNDFLKTKIKLIFDIKK